jgi:hypothetical protein
VLILPAEADNRGARRLVRMLPANALSLVRARRIGAWTLIAAERPVSSQPVHA